VMLVAAKAEAAAARAECDELRSALTRFLAGMGRTPPQELSMQKGSSDAGSADLVELLRMIEGVVEVKVNLDERKSSGSMTLVPPELENFLFSAVLSHANVRKKPEVRDFNRNQVTQANDAAEVVGTAMTDLEERCRRAEASAKSSTALELELRAQVCERFRW